MKLWYALIMLLVSCIGLRAQVPVYTEIIKSDAALVKSIAKFQSTVDSSEFIELDSTLTFNGNLLSLEFYDSSQVIKEKTYFNKSGDIREHHTFHYKQDTLRKIVSDSANHSWVIKKEISYPADGTKLDKAFFRDGSTETVSTQYYCNNSPQIISIINQKKDTLWAEYIYYYHTGLKLSMKHLKNGIVSSTFFYYYDDQNRLKHLCGFDETGLLDSQRTFKYITDNEYTTSVKDSKLKASGQSFHKQYLDSKGNIVKVYEQSFLSPSLWKITENKIEYY